MLLWCLHYPNLYCGFFSEYLQLVHPGTSMGPLPQYTVCIHSPTTLLKWQNIAFKNQAHVWTTLLHLPVEILCYIVFIIVSEWLPQPPCDYRDIEGEGQGSPNPELIRKNLGWVCFTHICSYLQDICLDYPQLWARDICRSRGCTLGTISEQAKNSPLTLST